MTSMTQHPTVQCNSTSGTPLSNSYTPRLDDYVHWKSDHTDLKGWVYFVDKEYCTIEISVKEKPDDLVHFHKKTHCCVVCYPQYWHELTYIKNRRDSDVDQYKSQEHRYSDPQ